MGSGGLIRAYTKSVSEAIDVAGIAEKQMMYDCFFEESMQDSGKVLNLLYNQGLFMVVDVQYSEKAKIILRMKEKDMDDVAQLLRELLSREVELSVIAKNYVEIAC